MSKLSSPTAPTDLELMLYADGELPPDEARAVAAWIAEHPEARAKVEGVHQVGDLLRTWGELEADAAEPRMEAAWQRIARGIHANGRTTADEAAEVPRTRRQRTVTREEPGLWASVRRWFGEHRGHLVTGAVTAGAVAALMFAIGPRERITERVRDPGVVGGGTPAALESQPPEVEDLEVYEGSGTVLTIEPEGKDDSGAAVIWISNDDEENTEDPI